MIKHRTFSSRHLINIVGDKSIKELEKKRQEAEHFIEKEIGEDAVFAITETSDEYSSTVTVWYRSG